MISYSFVTRQWIYTPDLQWLFCIRVCLNTLWCPDLNNNALNKSTSHKSWHDLSINHEFPRHNTLDYTERWYKTLKHFIESLSIAVDMTPLSSCSHGKESIRRLEIQDFQFNHLSYGWLPLFEIYGSVSAWCILMSSTMGMSSDFVHSSVSSTFGKSMSGQVEWTLWRGWCWFA